MGDLSRSGRGVCWRAHPGACLFLSGWTLSAHPAARRRGCHQQLADYGRGWHPLAEQFADALENQDQDQLNSLAQQITAENAIISEPGWSQFGPS